MTTGCPCEPADRKRHNAAKLKARALWPAYGGFLGPDCTRNDASRLLELLGRADSRDGEFVSPMIVIKTATGPREKVAT